MAPHEIWPFDPARFFADTHHLSDAEIVAYLKLLASYWANGGLPNDNRNLARIADKDLRTWQVHYRARLQKFFHHGWRHKRMDRDLAQASVYRAAQRRKANARWHPSYGPVDNGDRALRGATPFTNGGFANEINKGDDAAAYAGAMPLSKTIKSPFGTRERSADVDKLRNPVQASAVVSHGNDPNDSPTTPAQRRASQEVERALFADLGEAGFAQAIDILAADPDLMRMATKAELRKAGSGARLVIEILKKRLRVL